MNPEYVVVLTTLPADADGQAFGRALVEEKLAACVNLLPLMESVYRWEGRVEHETERRSGTASGSCIPTKSPSSSCCLSSTVTKRICAGLGIAPARSLSTWLPPSAFARSAPADRRSLGGGWSGGGLRHLAST
jgi:hypothetical protein